MQPVSMIMSNMNVEAMTHHAPNALAAAQDTGQTQEIVREGIRQVQRVQASDAAAEMQRVHRKTENDEREGQRRNNPGDSFVKSEESSNGHEDTSEPVIRENARTKKRVSFLA
ncbi:MAG: hypothetical protein IJR63_05505 [Synergistaceae bacterium]|nr:hypothetical protein [Synergistaceae bacterium]